MSQAILAHFFYTLRREPETKNLEGSELPVINIHKIFFELKGGPNSICSLYASLRVCIVPEIVNSVRVLKVDT